MVVMVIYITDYNNSDCNDIDKESPSQPKKGHF